MFRAAHPMQLVWGPIIWALWFVLIYAALSLVCSVAPPDADNGAITWINAALLGLTLLVTLILLACGLRCWRAAGKADGGDLFFSRVAAGVYLLSAAATLMIGLPVAVLPPCL